MYLNLPVRCPSSGTKNTTLETHTCKSPLLYLGCKNCRRRSSFVFSVSFPGPFHVYADGAGAPRPIKTLSVRSLLLIGLLIVSLC